MKKVLLITFFFLASLSLVWADQFRGAPQRGADDADEVLSNGYTDTLNTCWCIELMRTPSIDRWGGYMRFPNVTIPQGSTIDSAYIKVTASSIPFIRAFDSVACENVDNATIIEHGTGTYDISERWANPTTKILWDATMRASTVNPDSTPDLSSILQDIVNRPGWELGNAVGFIFKALAIDADTARYEPLNVRSTKRESLLVVYTPPAAEVGQMRIKDDWRFGTHFIRDWRFQDEEEHGILKIVNNQGIVKICEDGEIVKICK